ncbi:nucleoprotein [Hayes Yard virus]|uniref:Nucleoprotein n=1 Tax=Hayes Yard virus TaxID=2602440 RepID=A0A7D0MS05_9RHAB|nr:nucleoprotein [Hayes Yard virus]QEA08650.1 nucleoprotein [Hayes Yard virus]
MYCTLTKKEIIALKPQDAIPPQFPKEFFENGNKQKPTLRIPQGKLDLDTARELVYGGLERGELVIQHVIRYLYLIGEKVIDKLDDDWNSFGVNIGRKNQEINVWSFYNVVIEDDQVLDGRKSPKVDETDDLWLTLALLSYYRLGRSSNQNHRNNLLIKLNAQIKGYRKDAPNIVDDVAVHGSWVTNSNYCKVCAGFDMFLNRFKNNKYAPVRFGTVASRYKDAAALMSLGHLCDVTGMTIEGLLDWIFVSTVGEDVVKLMTEGNEIDDPYSYMPYMMDMGISNKSPYSSISCPNIYTFLHMIGALLTSERSRNARMISEHNLSNIRMNAFVVAFVKANKASMAKAFLKPEDRRYEKDVNGDEKDSSDDEDYEEEDEELGDMPKSADPMEWFVYLQAQHFTLPDKVNDFGQKECKKIQNARPGTIGKYLSTIG